MIIITNIRHDHDLYIGRARRGSYNKWGNKTPLNGKPAGTTINMHKRQLWEQLKSGEISPEEIHALNGKTLACFCVKDKHDMTTPCHGRNFELLRVWLVKENIRTTADFHTYLSSS